MASIITPHYQALIDAVHILADDYFYAGRVREALTILEKAMELSAAPDVKPASRVDILLHYGGILTETALYLPGYDHQKTISTLQKAARQAANDQQKAQALELTGTALYYQLMIRGNPSLLEPDDFEPFSHYFRQALPLYQEAGDFRGECSSLFHMGLMAYRRNHFFDAEALFWESVNVARTYGFKKEQSFSTRYLGLLAIHQADFRAAEDLLMETLRLRQEIGYRIGEPIARLALVDLYLRQDRPGKAIFEVQEAGRILAELQLEGPAPMLALLHAGDLLVEYNQFTAARECYGKAHHIGQNIKHAWGTQQATEALAALPAQSE